MRNNLPIFVDVSIAEIGLGSEDFERIINIHPNWERAIDRLLADLESEGVAGAEIEHENAEAAGYLPKNADSTPENIERAGADPEPEPEDDERWDGMSRQMS